MTHKIAIIKTREFSDYSDYDQYVIHRIAESITDWTEVSDEDFRLLCNASNRNNFMVLEQPVDTKSFIAKTVAEYTALVRAEEVRLAEEKRKSQEAALQRKLKKELRETKTKKALYEKLKEEFENK